MSETSRLPGFYQLSIEERIEKVTQWAGLAPEDISPLKRSLALAQGARMIENVIGTCALPLGIAVNFLINGDDYLIPMAIEEPSVVAGASFAARLVREGGGFEAISTDPLMIGQIQVLDLADPWRARFELLSAKEQILDLADQQHPTIVGLGGGARDLKVRVLPSSPVGPMLVAHLLYDVRDAMGANAVNTACEALAPLVEEITGGRVVLRILSNLADRRLARARCTIPPQVLAFDEFSGETVAQRVLEAHALAMADPYRAATHNKGIMNGIDAVAVATGHDWRTVEAGAHAYAANDGAYRPLSRWERDAGGNLVGTLELPLAVGTVGGATRVHPTARLARKILGIESARELAEVMCAVGLAQNLAALRALATEGIQRGHMELHARQMAIAAGAEGMLIEQVAERMVQEQAVRPDRAEEILRALRHGESLG
ncbi:MAG: hydroxymethylglutaryl-CoA reductase, degradative [Chloroflexota bacterium]|nr:hydroxymethylglutaryl-CoA reductase, degradative [Chloroflexota bacterium]